MKLSLLSGAQAALACALLQPSAAASATAEQAPSSFTSLVYKHVKSLIGVEGSVGDESINRALTKNTTAITLRCFEECVEQDLDAEECEAYIKSVLGDDFSKHEIPKLHVQVSRPRSPPILAATYWMIGIPSNVYGEVDCDINNGVIRYKFLWETDEGDFSIPDVPCMGMNANDCCNEVLNTVISEGIPLQDKNGNCLSCWVHQEPLEPVIASTGEVAYIEHHAVPGEGVCEDMQLTKEAVQQVDATVEAALADVAQTMDDMIANGASCVELRALQHDLLFLARGFPKAMSRISNFLCPYCPYQPTDEAFDELPYLLISMMNTIKDFFVGKKIASDTNKLIIYTDHAGKVMEPPKIGGSRSELDWDRDDPACSEDDDLTDDQATMAPVPSPVSLVGGGEDTKAPTSSSSSSSPSPSLSGETYAPVAYGTHSPLSAPVVPAPTFINPDLCVPPQEYNSATDRCECPGELIAVSPQLGYCGCLGMLQPYTNPITKEVSCECPGETVPVDGFDILCECAGDLVLTCKDDAIHGNCQCPGMTQKTGPNGDKCICPGVKELVPSSGGYCICPETTDESKITPGACDCEAEYQYQKADGSFCFNCVNPEFPNFADGTCFPCPAPKIANTEDGSCLCPETTRDDGNGGCICKHEFEFKKTDGSVCFNCDEEKDEYPFFDEGECFACPAPKIPNTSTGECLCPTTKVPDEENGGCKCAPGLDHEKTDGSICFACDEGGDGKAFPDYDEGKCFVPDCAFPAHPDGAGQCICPESMTTVTDEDGGVSCVCVAEEGKFLDVNGSACYSCPETLTSDGKGGCECQAEYLYQTSDKSTCFSCKPSETPNLLDGSCFVCPYPKVANSAKGTCDCPASTIADGVGSCKCQDEEGLFLKADKSLCFRCDDPAMPFPNLKSGVCFACEDPKIPEYSNGACLCPNNTKENDDEESKDVCICPDGEHMKEDGTECFKCTNMAEEYPDFSRAVCFICPAPKVANTSDGSCSCPNNTIQKGDICTCPKDMPFLTTDGTKCFKCSNPGDYPNYNTGECFTCSKPKIPNTKDGSCACPPTTIPDGVGSCTCPENKGLFLTSEKSRCFSCPKGKFPNLSTGQCFDCAKPKIANTANGSCNCPATTVPVEEADEEDAGIGGCKCAPEYTYQQSDGSRCFNCLFQDACLSLDEGGCFLADCAFPKIALEPSFCECGCPETMTTDMAGNCVCEEEKGMYLTPDKNGCYKCPETLTSDGKGGCMCKPEFEFLKTNEEMCFNCGDEEVPDFKKGGCFTCPSPKEPDDENVGSCKCPSSTVADGEGCGCEKGLFQKEDGSLCFICEDEKFPNLSLGTCFECPAPKIPNIHSGSCDCPRTKFLDEASGACKCKEGLEFEKTDGSLCFNCPGKNSFPVYETGVCKTVDCPFPQEPNEVGECECPESMTKEDDECTCNEEEDLFKNGAGNECYSCPGNLVGDGNEGCKCPEGLDHLTTDGLKCFACAVGESPKYADGSCFVCAKPKVADVSLGQCVCPPTTIEIGEGCGCEEGKFLRKDGSLCFTCSNGLFPDKSKGVCFDCPSPKIANVENGACTCPPTTVPDGEGGCKCAKESELLTTDGSKCFSCSPEECPDMDLGTCIVENCPFPSKQDGCNGCVCPDSMAQQGSKCFCRNKENKYATSLGDACYTCPPTQRSDGQDGCKCKEEFPYQKDDGTTCFACSDEESPNFKSGECFTCPSPQVPNEIKGVCECPLTTEMDEEGKACVCGKGFEFQTADTSKCFNCLDGEYPNFNTGMCFTCPYPKNPNRDNGACLCPMTLEDDEFGGCRCQSHLQYKTLNAKLCFNCPHGQFPDLKAGKCFDCPAPKIANINTGSCVCPPTTVPVGDGCGCESGLFRKADGSMCFECDEGEFPNLQTATCFECEAPRIPNEQTGQCGCPYTKIEDGQGGCKCSPGYEFEKTDGSLCFNCPDYKKAILDEGKCEFPDCPFPQAGDIDGVCQCPAGMIKDGDDCVCDNENGEYLTSTEDGCYPCPDTMESDGADGCKCRPEFEHKTLDGFLCFNCVGELFPNLDDGTCFSCAYPKVADVEDGSCTCPAPTTIENDLGGCKCTPGFDHLKSDESLCFNCEGGEYPNLKDGSCFTCPFPKQANTANGGCSCPATTQDDGESGCKCADGYEFEKADGSMCFNCESGESPNFKDGTCFTCPFPKLPKTEVGTCVCPPSTIGNENEPCTCAPGFMFQKSDGSSCFNCAEYELPNMMDGTCFTCDAPKIPDTTDGSCDCPATTVDNGEGGCKCLDAFKFQKADKTMCFNCLPGEYPNFKTGTCFACPFPKSADSDQGTCTCPATTEEDAASGGCKCKNEYAYEKLDGSMCFNCPEGEFPNLSTGECFPCPLPQIADTLKGTCLCPPTTVPSSGAADKVCECAEGLSFQTVDGSKCFNCSSGQFPNLSDGTCFSCPFPRVANELEGTCSCPDTTMEKDGICQCAEGYPFRKDDGEYCFKCFGDEVPNFKSGQCLDVDCAYPQFANREAQCVCPEGMTQEAAECKCDASDNQYVNMAGNGCYSCPSDTLTSDGKNGCKCKPSFSFLKNDKSMCFSCGEGKMPNLEKGTCSCLPHLVENDKGECVCPGETVLGKTGCCHCEGKKQIKPGTMGECECPPELVENDQGTCGCPHPLVSDPSSGKCVCPGQTKPTGPNGECQCPAENLFISDAAKGECSPCENGFVSADQSGCEVCKEPKIANFFLKKCICPYPLTNDEATGECVCPGETLPTGPDGKCECPDNNTFLSCPVLGKCQPCLNGFVKADQRGCDRCEYPKIANLSTKTCDCPFPLVDNGYQGCMCPGDTKPCGPGGACQCGVNMYLESLETGKCLSCGNGFVNTDQTGCDVCPEGKVADLSSQKCVCPYPSIDDGAGGCKCPGMTKRVEDGFCGCPENMKEDKSGPVGSCRCEVGYEPVPGGEGCYQCPNNMLADGAGGCMCPEGLFMNKEKDACFVSCPSHLYLSSEDGGLTYHCSPNEADACPEGSIMKDGWCVGCNCGFCPARDSRSADEEMSGCCEPANQNQCKSSTENSSKKGCSFDNKNPFYPGFGDSTGDVCSYIGVEGGKPTIGCGCKPSSNVPCTYDDEKDGCSVCSVEDLADSSDPEAECGDCKSCLKEFCEDSWDGGCKMLLLGQTAGSSEEWASCLKDGYSLTGSAGAGATGRQLRELSTEGSKCSLNCQDRCRKYKRDPTPRYADNDCKADDLSVDSAGFEEGCFNCRKCIFYQCRWLGECWKIARGERQASPEEWANCLATDGQVQDKGRKLTGDIHHKKWCDCAHKCKSECKKQEDTLTAPPVYKGGMCTAAQISDLSNTEDQVCFNCRKCIFDRCQWKGTCWKIARGEWKATPMDWAKCLQSDGKMQRSRRLTSTGEQYNYDGGHFDTWSDCAKSCDKQCTIPESPEHKQEQEDEGICNAEEISAGTKSMSGKCYECKQCIHSKCRWFGTCAKIASGHMLASAHEWAKCLVTDGRTHGNGDIYHDGGVAEGNYGDWANCARKCKVECTK